MVGGTAVTITGSRFVAGSSVTFGGVAAAAVAFTNATTLVATSPAGTGVADVVVTTPGGTSATSVGDLFSYAPVPTVSAVTPAAGPLSGGTVVTVTGTGFTPGSTTASFGSGPAPG